MSALPLKALKALEERRKRLAEETQARFPKPKLYSDNGAEEFKKQVSLVDLVNRLAGLNLTADTREIKTNCPFPDHEDKNPSFSINTIENVFICFGCNRAGDIYNFMAEWEGLDYRRDFQKVKERICEVMGITLNNVEPKSVKIVEPAPSIIDIAAVRKVVQLHYPVLWPSVEACLSCIATLRLADLQHPVALNLVGDPSSGKSLIVSWIAANKEHVYRTDHFTPKAIVSHAANIKEKDREKVHMLPKIQDKVVAISELAPMFRGRADDIRDNCIRLIRLLDGEGWIGDSGTAGRQGFEGEYLFAWIGCTTPLEYKIWDIFGQLGPRLWFHGIPKEDKTPEQRHADACSGHTTKERNRQCRDAVAGLIDSLLGGRRYDIEWDIRNDPDEVCLTIQKFADLVAHARGLVRVAIHPSRDDLQLEHSTPIVEAPYRAYNVLMSIARGHAILYNRRTLSGEDLPVIKRIAMSTMPDDRRVILPKLIQAQGILNTNEICEVLRCSKSKALISMEAMNAVGLVKTNKGTGPIPDEIVLEDKFQWLLTEEFSSISVCRFDTVRDKNA